MCLLLNNQSLSLVNHAGMKVAGVADKQTSYPTLVGYMIFFLQWSISSYPHDLSKVTFCCLYVNISFNELLYKPSKVGKSNKIIVNARHITLDRRNGKSSYMGIWVRHHHVHFVQSVIFFQVANSFKSINKLVKSGSCRFQPCKFL